MLVCCYAFALKKNHEQQLAFSVSHFCCQHISVTQQSMASASSTWSLQALTRQWWMKHDRRFLVKSAVGPMHNEFRLYEGITAMAMEKILAVQADFFMAWLGSILLPM